MKKDIFCYYERPLGAVRDAFVQTVTQQYGKDCTMQGTVLSFKLSYSIVYNMNGGTLTVHLMPYQNGTAVQLHYSIRQLVGAFYKEHAADLTKHTDNYLQAKIVEIALDANQFTAFEQSGAAAAYAFAQPVAAANPAPPAATAGIKFCTNCGTKLNADAKFCTGCGSQQH